jgi:uncharacterized protein YkwD
MKGIVPALVAVLVCISYGLNRDSQVQYRRDVILSLPAQAGKAKDLNQSTAHSVGSAEVVGASSLDALRMTALPAQAQSQILPRNESERELFELLNHERAANNLPEMKWDDALFKAARQHALLMLDLNMMEHQLPNEPALDERLTNAGARFTYIAENIALGKDPATIHNGWMHSPGHRANILSPRITAVGIAVVRGVGGLFAVEDFSQSFGSESLEQQEKQVAALLAAKGWHVTGAAEDARKSCDGSLAVPGTRSGAVVRFETGDLSAFDAELEKKIRTEPYRNVAVGACRVREGAGFSRYKIALVFY